MSDEKGHKGISRAYLFVKTRHFFFFFTSNVCIFLYLNYSTTKRKRKKREPVAFSGLWVGVAEGENKKFGNKITRVHWRGGKEESKLVQVSGWDALLLGITTIWGNRLLGNSFVCGGGVGQRRNKAEFRCVSLRSIICPHYTTRNTVSPALRGGHWSSFPPLFPHLTVIVLHNVILHLHFSEESGESTEKLWVITKRQDSVERG